MTNKQLFNAFGGVHEKYLSEMLDDGPQRAVELRSVKRSPIKFMAMITAACLAVAGITAGSVYVGKHGGISALMRGNSTVQGESISENCSVSLENIVLDDDWLKDYPSDFLENIFSGYDYSDELPSNLSEYVGRDTSYDFTPVTADLKLSFSAWDKLPNEEVMAQVQFFADGEPIKFILFKDPYYYHPDYETKFKQDEFDPIMLVYDIMGYFTLDKARADNASSDSEEKTYEFPVTFDVKKGTHQITAAVEFHSIEPGYSSSFESFSEVITRTYLIDSTIKPPAKTYTFTTNGSGKFTTERPSPEYAQTPTSIFTNDRTLIINTSGVSSKTPYYLMVLMNGRPIECFDGKCSLLIDPADQKEDFTYKIPEECVYDGIGTSPLWLLTIPVVDKKFNGVYATSITPRYLITTMAKSVHVTDPAFDSKQDNISVYYDPYVDALYTLYSDKETYKIGEKIHIIAKVENLSDKPLEMFRYLTTDPTATESVISPLIIEIDKLKNYDKSNRFHEDERNGQNLIIEPGEVYYREAVIDTSQFSESGKYIICVQCYSPDEWGRLDQYVEIELTDNF